MKRFLVVLFVLLLNGCLAAKTQPFVYPPMNQLQLPVELPLCGSTDVDGELGSRWSSVRLRGTGGAPDVILVCMSNGKELAWHAFVVVEVK